MAQEGFGFTMAVEMGHVEAVKLIWTWAVEIEMTEMLLNVGDYAAFRVVIEGIRRLG